jgi:hypothetical protein
LKIEVYERYEVGSEGFSDLGHRRSSPRDSNGMKSGSITLYSEHSLCL